jgi:hypothetical protein
MTDRYYALTIALERDIREDDCEHLINAIKMLRGVLNVTPNVVSPDTWMAEQRALSDLQNKIYKVLRDK